MRPVDGVRLHAGISASSRPPSSFAVRQGKRQKRHHHRCLAFPAPPVFAYNYMSVRQSVSVSLSVCLRYDYTLLYIGLGEIK